MDFRNELIEDINWRMSEIAIAKTTPFRFSLPDVYKEFLIKHSIPIIYAIWEGFVKTCIEIYSRELNKLELQMAQFSKNIVTNCIEIQYPQINHAITSYDQTVKLTDNLLEYFNESFKIIPKVPSTNNINLKCLNNILNRFCIPPIDNEHYKSGLHKLLKFRNAIVHGDNSIVVEPEIVSEFSTLIYDLMYAVFENIESSYNSGLYKRET